MIIRKSVRINSSSHIVLNCSSDRCRRTYHSHSPLVEIFIDGSSLDNAGMIVDFGLLGNFKKFLKMFYNTLMLWDKDPLKDKIIEEYSEEVELPKNVLRYIILPFNPSAELLALYFHTIMRRIIKRTEFKNGESSDIDIIKVRYHETKTGYAESEVKLLDSFEAEYDLNSVYISPAVVEIDNPDLLKIKYIMNGSENITFSNPDVELKVKEVVK